MRVAVALYACACIKRRLRPYDIIERVCVPNVAIKGEMIMDTIIKDITLRDIIAALFRQKILIIMTVSIIMIGVFLGLLFQTPLYEAKVIMHIKGISQIESETYQGIGPFRVHLTQMQIVRSRPVIKRAVKALKLNERPLDYEKIFCHPLKQLVIDYKVGRLREEFEKMTPEKQRDFLELKAEQTLMESLGTDLLPNTDIFVITAQDYTPEGAMAIANVVSRSYAIYDQQQQLAEMIQRYGRLHPSVQQLMDNIRYMELNLSGEQLPDLDAIGTASVKIVQQATSNFEPVGRPKKVVMIIALFMSVFVAFSLAFIIDILDQSFKSPEEIVHLLGIPFLGSIPQRNYRDPIFLKDAFRDSMYTQFYEDLSEQIYIFMKTQRKKSILLTSYQEDEENSVLLSNIGYCLAQKMNHKVLIIDANLRGSSLNRIFNFQEGPGFANLLESNLLEYHPPMLIEEKQKANNDVVKAAIAVTAGARVKSAGQSPAGTPAINIARGFEYSSITASNSTMMDNLIKKVDSNLDVLPPGRSFQNPIVLMEKFNIKRIINEAKQNYEAVLFDCANLKNYSDVLVLSKNLDGIIIAIDAEKDKRQPLKNSIEQMKSKGVNILGFIFNNRKFVIPDAIYKHL